MNFTLFISKKFLFSKKESKFISAISFIAVAGVAIGVAVLIIALSVVNGFQKEIQTKLVGLYSHIDLSAFEGQKLPSYKVSIPVIYQVDTSQITSISPYIAQLALIRSSQNREGVYVKGILQEHDISDLKNLIIEGTYELSNLGDMPTIIIGKKLANKLGLKINDKATIFALRGFVLPSAENPPNIKYFRVAGIYESGISEYDDLNVYIHLQSAQELFSYDNWVSGYDIMLKNANSADSLAQKLMSSLGHPFYARSVFQIHKNIFTWIELQKKPIPIVLGLIIIVAVFNILATLLIIVLEKTNAIGILKSLGASISHIKQIFLINGFVIGVLGTLAGNVLALSLLYLQKNYDIIKIPEGIYFINKVPILIAIDYFLITSITSITLSILASYLPAALASKSNPISAIKFS
jgi:lipoprotein-releasing system permease protein